LMLFVQLRIAVSLAPWGACLAGCDAAPSATGTQDAAEADPTSAPVRQWARAREDALDGAGHSEVELQAARGHSASITLPGDIGTVVLHGSGVQQLTLYDIVLARHAANFAAPLLCATASAMANDLFCMSASLCAGSLPCTSPAPLRHPRSARHPRRTVESVPLPLRRRHRQLLQQYVRCSPSFVQLRIAVAPMTSSPASRSTGMLSPVTIASSTLDRPNTMVPSARYFHARFYEHDHTGSQRVYRALSL